MRTVQNWTRQRLTYIFPEVYRDLYLEEKGKIGEVGTKANSRAQGRAKTRLVQLYPEKYQELRQIAIRKGYARSLNRRPK